MKNLIVLFSIFISLSTQADIFGKYKLEFQNGLSGSAGTYEFTLNSDFSVNEVNDEGDYYVSSFNVVPFFGEAEITAEWGSDEDHHYFVMNLINNNDQAVLTSSCGVYVDGPNDYIDFDEAYSVLKKWNNVTSRFEVVNVKTTSYERIECRKKLENLIK